MNYFEDYDDIENPKNRSDYIAKKIAWLQKAIAQLEKKIETPPADIDDYLIETYKDAIEEFKIRIQNLSNGKDEFTGKPIRKDPDDYGPNDNLIELMDDDEYGPDDDLMEPDDGGTKKI